MTTKLITNDKVVNMRKSTFCLNKIRTNVSTHRLLFLQILHKQKSTVTHQIHAASQIGGSPFPPALCTSPPHPGTASPE